MFAEILEGAGRLNENSSLDRCPSSLLPKANCVLELFFGSFLNISSPQGDTFFPGCCKDPYGNISNIVPTRQTSGLPWAVFMGYILNNTLIDQQGTYRQDHTAMGRDEIHVKSFFYAAKARCLNQRTRYRVLNKQEQHGWKRGCRYSTRIYFLCQSSSYSGLVLRLQRYRTYILSEYCEVGYWRTQCTRAKYIP